MAFTVEDFEDLVRLLGEHPEWRDQLRRLVLADDLLRLPRLVEELVEKVHALAEAQRRTETRLESLAEAQQRTEARLEALAEAQQRTEARLEALAEAQQRTEARLEALASAQHGTEQRLAELAAFTDQGFREIRAQLKDMGDDLAQVKGYALEGVYRDRAAAYFGRVLQGLKMVRGDELDRLLEAAVASGTITWEERDDVLSADLVARGRLRSTGQEAYLAAEVSWGVGSDDVERAQRRAATLQKVTGRALAAVAGKSILPEARRLAEKLGIIRVTDGRLESSQAGS